MIFTIEKDPHSLRCPCCKSGQVIRRGFQTRWFHALPIGRKQIYIKLDIPRVFCRLCSFVRRITIGFADARFTYTKSFERYGVELSRHMTIQDVAIHLDVGWDTIKEI
jgi:transposase